MPQRVTEEGKQDDEENRNRLAQMADEQPTTETIVEPDTTEHHPDTQPLMLSRR